MSDPTKHPTADESPERSRDAIYAFADLLQQQYAEQEETVEETSLWVAFTTGERACAVPIETAREIHRVGEILRVPEAPPSVCGVVQLRGRGLPLVDLAARCGLGESEITPSSRILLVESHDRLVGLLVDSVERVVELERSRLEADTGSLDGGLAARASGTCHHEGRTLALIDIEKVLRTERTPTTATRSAANAS